MSFGIKLHTTLGLGEVLVLTSFKSKQRLNKIANVKLTNQCQITEHQAGTTARLFANEEMSSVCQNLAKPNVAC